MRLMVCGGRHFYNKELLEKSLDEFIKANRWKTEDIAILEGGATGADNLAEEYAKKKGFTFIVYPADWEKYGKAAGPIRNKQMVEDCDYCVAFWDGQSKGTKSSIDFCKFLNKPCKIVYYNK